jgi:GT2 family glycosyltransferase
VSPAETPAVDVVIVSYECREPLLAALAALGADGPPARAVWLVDNASRDGSAAAVRERYPAVHVIANDRNLGFAAACNQGWRAGHAPLLLFLNPDAEATASAVAGLAARLDARGDAGVAGPRTRSADGCVQVSSGPDLTLRGERRQRRLVLGVARRDPTVLAEAEALHAVEREVDWVSGACLMARRAVLERVGGFDEGFFLYEEDADLCRRVRAAGWRVLFTPAAEIRHGLGQSMAKAPARARLEYQRSHIRYYAKHNGADALLGLRALLAARGIAGWVRAVATGDRGARGEALALARLALTL